MKVLLITEPNASLMVGLDTSVLLAQDLVHRKAVVDYCDYSELNVDQDIQSYLSQISVFGVESVDPNHPLPLKLSSKRKTVKAGDYDVILQRMDPPVNEKYRKHCQHYMHVSKNILQLNNPEWTWQLGEHLLPQDYPEVSIPTFESETFNSFLKNVRGNSPESVAKPSNLFGGKGIEFFKSDTNETVLEKYWDTWGPGVVVQPFLSEITKVGDLRILTMNEKIVGSVLRMPQPGSRLANMHRGASAHPFTPIAGAAANTAVKIIEEEGLVENSRKVGAYFLEKIKPFAEKYSFIGDVRGAGLFLGIELVKDKGTKEPLPKSVCNFIFNENLKRGLLTMSYAPSFRLQPSMTIDTGTIDQVVEILTEVFDLAERERVWERNPS